MTAAENRSSANLLLLCLKHADEIDLPERVEGHPVDQLLAWKAAQQTASAQAVSKWRLSDEEATEVIEQSFPPTTISVQGETIIVGGLGGGPGGAGGGGGAIGPGALGGSGGSVGFIDLDGEGGTAPGAGGGGGGVIAPGAILPDPGLTRATEGEGYSAGTDATDRGDTTISVGDTVLVRAAGGKSGLVGTGDRLHSGAFSVSTMTFVRFGEIAPTGLVSLLSSGFQSISILNAPAPVAVSLLIVFEAGAVPAGEYTGAVTGHDPDDVERVKVRFPITVSKSGDILRIPRFCELNFEAAKLGLWTFKVATDRELATLKLLIIRTGEE